MIVYVETNFLLELAYQQERWEHCREILHLSIRSRITLRLPAFSAAEARATLGRRASERRALQAELDRQIREISRSEMFRTLRDDSRDVVSALVAGGEDSRNRLEEAIGDIRSHGRIIPLTADVIEMARHFELRLSLSPADALVLSSVSTDESGEPGDKIFITQDVKAFSTPSLREYLPPNLKVLTNFADAVDYLKARLPQQ